MVEGTAFHKYISKPTCRGRNTHSVAKQKFSELMNSGSYDYILFTDASKSMDGVACLVTSFDIT
ncbi:hypothetical protein HHI36_010507, partial [Cryptolaemus montrouzieri]